MMKWDLASFSLIEVDNLLHCSRTWKIFPCISIYTLVLSFVARMNNALFLK